MATPITIADAAVAVAGDLKQFDKDLDKGLTDAEARSKTAGQRIAAALSPQNLGRAIGVAAGAAALTLGVAAKGALDLQNAVAAYQSATGASADEAERAGKTINRVAGEERASLESVTEVAIRVKRDMGATGDEADALTQKFVRFARVTKQDAAGAVSAYDDILDSWNLTAADAGTIMDKLLVSNQRFGGDITETQKTLAALAPAMRAANLSIDDGISLLGLFGAKGLDAGQASAAFAKALTKVKSPDELKALIKDIEDTQDPFARASKAADLFGAKAGAKLANALGGANLDDYAISVDDAAGAVDRAADVIDNTITGKIQKALSIGVADLREWGSAFGPGLSGAAALASLLKPLGAGKLISGLLVTPAGFGPKLAKTLAGTIAGSAAGTIVKAAWTKAGSVGATAYLKALFAGDALSAALSKAASSSVVTGALDKTGSLLGGRLGTAMKGAFLLAVGTIVVDLLAQLADLDQRIAGQSHDIGTNVGKEIAAGSLESLQQSKAALEKGISDLGVFAMLDFTGQTNRVQQQMRDQLDKVNAEIASRFVDLDRAAWNTAHSVSGATEDVGTSLVDVGDHAESMARRAVPKVADVGSAFFNLKQRAINSAGAIKTALSDMVTSLVADARTLISGYYDPILAQQELQVTKDEDAADRIAVAEARKALALTKPGSAARKQAEADLHSAVLAQTRADETLDNARLDLLASGALSKKEQSAWLTDLQKRYKTATGDAKTKLQGLIAKIKELQGVQGGGIDINVNIRSGYASGSRVGTKAGGGVIPAGEWSWVGEKGRELIGPADQPRLVIPNGPSEALSAFAAGSGGDTYNLGPISVTAGSDVSPVAARRFGQAILDEIAGGLRDQRRRTTG